MKTLVPPKRKLFELIVLIILTIIFYFLYPSTDAIVLFIFGFIWNWSASNDLSLMFENRRYRMSMLKTVVNLQNLFLKPFLRAPTFVKKIVSVLPAGIFWSLVIFINDSDMPWWSTFIGSLMFELVQLEMNFIKSHKEVP